LFAIRGLGCEFEVAEQVSEGGRQVAFIEVEDSSFLVGMAGIGVGLNEQVHDGDGFGELLAAVVGVAEVPEHAEEDLLAAHRGHGGWGGVDIDVRDFECQVAALSHAQDAAFVEWIDEGGVVTIVVADQEMTGESDAVDGTPEAVCDGKVNHRERNGDAGAVGKDFIEATVAGVVVIGLIAAEGEIVEEVVAGGFDKFLAGGLGVAQHGEFAGVGVEDFEEGGGVQAGEFERGQAQSGLVQGNGLIAFYEEFSEVVHSSRRIALV